MASAAEPSSSDSVRSLRGGRVVRDVAVPSSAFQGTIRREPHAVGVVDGEGKLGCVVRVSQQAAPGGGREAAEVALARASSGCRAGATRLEVRDAVTARTRVFECADGRVTSTPSRARSPRRKRTASAVVT